MCLSVPQIAAAPTRISISSGAGFGRGHSRTSVPSGPSLADVLTTASISARSLSRDARFRLCARIIRPSISQRGCGPMSCADFREKSLDDANERIAVGFVDILVQCAFNQVDRLARPAGIVELARHTIHLVEGAL